jgi:hypothetical protein
MKVVNNIRIGKPDVDPKAPTHVAGVPEGNAAGGTTKNPGFYTDDGGTTRTTMARSTGINPSHRDPILSDMPNLGPA